MSCVSEKEEPLQELPQESSAKLLDDLFKKTTATPVIYWLPLTEQDALERVKEREMREQKRREDQAAREAESKARYERRSPPARRVSITFFSFSSQKKSNKLYLFVFDRIEVHLEEDTEEVLLPIEEGLPLLQFIIVLLLEEEAEEEVHQEVTLDPGVDHQEEHPPEGVGVQSEEVL